MAEWRTVRLRELLTDTKDGDWGKGEPTPGHVPVHVIRGTDFPSSRLGNVADVPLRFFSGRTVHRRLLQPNDILIETAGGSRDRPTGRTLLVTEQLLDLFPGEVSCASFARFLRVDPRKANPRFVFWYLQDLYNSGGMWVHQVQHTGVARFQFTRFAETEEVPVPARATQDAMVEMLGALEDKIAVNERITVTASELGAAYYSATPQRESVRIADVAEVTMGQSPPGSTFNEQGNGLPFYQGTRDFGFRFPGHRVWCTAVTRQAKADDVLVSVRAPVGRINVATEPCGIGRGLASVRSETNPHVLFQALSADPSMWLPYEAEGTVFGSINKKQFAQLEIGWPTVGRASLEARLSVLDQRIRRAADESRALATLRDALLPRLMSGRLRVREAGKLVEDAV